MKVTEFLSSCVPFWQSFLTMRSFFWYEKPEIQEDVVEGFLLLIFHRNGNLSIKINHMNSFC